MTGVEREVDFVKEIEKLKTVTRFKGHWMGDLKIVRNILGRLH